MSNTNAAFGKTSVIIPCYRAAATLRRAVQSALDGAPADLEILLIDDGSPTDASDNTPALCDALAAEFPAVRALHRKNGGAGAARNTGLDAAAGDWILFLDADDALLPGLWSALDDLAGTNYHNAPQTPDMILYGMTRASGDVPNPLSPGFYPDLKALGSALEPLLFTTGYLAAPYPKLFRRASLGSLRFDERLQINEDVLFNTIFLQKSTAIYCLNGVYYMQYDLNGGSLSRRLRGDLLDAEVITRPALAGLLAAAGFTEAEAAPYLATSQTRAALNQYGLLTGCKGRISLAERRALFARILANDAACAALQARLAGDAHPLLSIPYRIGLSLKAPGLLAAYTHLKNHFLP